MDKLNTTTAAIKTSSKKNGEKNQISTSPVKQQKQPKVATPPSKQVTQQQAPTKIPDQRSASKVFELYTQPNSIHLQKLENKYKVYLDKLEHNINVLIQAGTIDISLRPTHERFDVLEFGGDSYLNNELSQIALKFQINNSRDCTEIKKWGGCNELLALFYQMLNIAGKMVDPPTSPMKSKADIMEVMIYEIFKANNQISKTTFQLLVLLLLQFANTIALQLKNGQEISTSIDNELKAVLNKDSYKVSQPEQSSLNALNAMLFGNTLQHQEKSVITKITYSSSYNQIHIKQHTIITPNLLEQSSMIPVPNVPIPTPSLMVLPPTIESLMANCQVMPKPPTPTITSEQHVLTLSPFTLGWI